MCELTDVCQTVNHNTIYAISSRWDIVKIYKRLILGMAKKQGYP